MRAMWETLLVKDLAPPDGVDDFMRLARTLIARRITAKAARAECGQAQSGGERGRGPRLALPRALRAG